MKKLIGLCGFAQTGKDSAAEHMYGWQRYAFADALKADLLPLLDRVGCDLSDPDDKEDARDLLVAWGATARKFEPRYWIRRCFESIRGEHEHIVFTDVRYANEVGAILNFGGHVVHIKRPGIGAKNDEEFRSFAKIKAEYPDLPVVINDGTKLELAAKVLAASKMPPIEVPDSMNITAASRDLLKQVWLEHMRRGVEKSTLFDAWLRTAAKIEGAQARDILTPWQQENIPTR